MAKGKFAKKRKRPPLWYYAAVVLLLSVFVFCLCYLGSYFLNSRQQAEGYDDLASLVEAARGTAPTQSLATDAAGSTIPDGDFEMMATTPPDRLHNEDGILWEYAQLHEMNPDIAGWICIEGTKINYPVMHTPDRPDHYLKRNFQGEYSEWGCLYAREECDLMEPSDNVTIYGHNMRDGSMFAGLHSYTKQDFWENHRYIRFDTMAERHTYEIFAVFTTTASEGQGFAYHDFIYAADEADFDAFIANCLANGLYDTGIVPEYGDKIICLSTCEYSQVNGRLVVAAVRID